MTSEDQDILAKISQLAGQINRHKNSQISDHQAEVNAAPRANAYGGYPHSSTGWRPKRGGYLSRGFVRGGRQAQVHRNRTLVLNGSNPTASSNIDLEPTAAKEAENPSTTGNAGFQTPAWVTKTDRHLQLINTSIFEKDSQKRAKAIEETRQQKLKHKDEREKARFNKHLQRMNSNIYHPSSSRSTDSKSYEVTVQGIRFRVAKNGSKLVKIPGESALIEASKQVRLGGSVNGLRSSGDLNAAKFTPKTAIVGGVRFYRSQTGNMYRAGVVKAHRRNGIVKKIDEPCKIFTTTGTPLFSNSHFYALEVEKQSGLQLTPHCFIGSCTKGPRCRYIHDPSKVAVCKEFLQKGSCPSGDSCDLSHELTPERTPTCLHFAKGNCSNPNCSYTHVKVSPSALVCRAFGMYGYCEKGASCTERHVNECPDFSNTGTCTIKGCKLLHRHKASVMRSNIRTGDQSTEDETSDISSDDDDDEIGSDDVDSDDLDEEFFGEDNGNIDVDIPTQADYVQFS